MVIARPSGEPPSLTRAAIAAFLREIRKRSTDVLARRAQKVGNIECNECISTLSLSQNKPAAPADEVGPRTLETRIDLRKRVTN